MGIRINFYKDNRKTRILKSFYLLPLALVVYPLVSMATGFFEGILAFYSDCRAAWRK